jgi:hypothetical protein
MGSTTPMMTESQRGRLHLVGAVVVRQAESVESAAKRRSRSLM